MHHPSFLKKLIKEKHYLSEKVFDTKDTQPVLEALDYIFMQNGGGRMSARAAFLWGSMVTAISR